MNGRWRRYLRFFGPNIDADVDEELRFHLEMRARDYAARGLTKSGAWRAANERFGDFAHVTTALREHDQRLARTQRTRDLMDDLAQDIRYAMRSLRRAPGFAVVAILTLALGIGANTAMFSIVDAVLVRALPFPRPQQLVAISASTLAEFTRVRELNRSYGDVASYRVVSLGLSGDAEPERVDAASVSWNLLSTLGVSPIVGRAFTTEENTPGRNTVVVLSFGLWTRRYAGDRAVIGRHVMIEGAPYTVVGVMPRAFSFPTRDTQLWVPIALPPSRSGIFWGDAGYRTIARLRDGVTADAAQHELRALFAQIRHENPIWDPGAEYGSHVTVTALQQRLVGTAQTILWLLFGVVGIVLLIACANVANLLLVRATSRRREIAVRMALGGGRGRIIRQLLTESVTLALLGGLAGLGIAWWGLRALVAMLPADIPRVATIGIDPRVFAFTTLLVVVTGLAFGLMPAMRASAASTHNALRDGSRTAGGVNRRLTSLLVCGEIGAAAVLVIAALLLVRSMWLLHRVDPGFRTAAIVTARITPPAQRFTDAKTIVPFLDELEGRIRVIPGVEAVSVVDQLPLSRNIRSIAMRIEGQFEDVRHDLPMIDHYQTVTPNYFATMGIRLVAGRPLTDTDRAGTPDVALVSESFARHFWPKGDAVGKRIGYPWPSEWVTIVGVVRDAKLDSLTGTSEETFYRPIRQAPVAAVSLVVRTADNVASIATALRTAVGQVDPGTPISDVQTMRSIVDRSAARQRFTMMLLSLFACVALVLGVIGIYGVMSYAVAQRTREIGVRMALGASPGDAQRMVLAEGLALGGAGVAIGIVGAAASTRALGGLLYGITALDPMTFVAVPVGLMIVALLASYLPARRATRVDPTTALRAD
jgi:putative ABC transport system permease protein